ncbi:unnamed protein product, partial [Dovyalis caffra]
MARSLEVGVGSKHVASVCLALACSLACSPACFANADADTLPLLLGRSTGVGPVYGPALHVRHGGYLACGGATSP